jgi:hypothetical protein
MNFEGLKVHLLSFSKKNRKQEGFKLLQTVVSMSLSPFQLVVRGKLKGSKTLLLIQRVARGLPPFKRRQDAIFINFENGSTFC